MNNDDIVWKSDSLRKKWDIRLRPQKELSWYQKRHKMDIDKQIQAFKDKELAHAIRRTLDGTLLEELDNRLISKDETIKVVEVVW